MHGFEVRFEAHHYALTSCLAHAQCTIIGMNLVCDIHRVEVTYRQPVDFRSISWVCLICKIVCM